MAFSIIQQMQLQSSRIITLVGAGGKTSLLYALCTEFAQKENTLLTTTTHIWEPHDLPGAILVTDEDTKQLNAAFLSSRLVALGKSGKKWSSLSLSFLAHIQNIPSRIVCEGDGSRGLPVKIPRKNEPVFYPETDTVIGIIGLSCLGKPAKTCLFGYTPNRHTLTADFPELATVLKEEKGILSPRVLELIAVSPRGLKKGVTTEKFHVVFNQADCLSEENKKAIQTIAKKIRDNGDSCHIVSLKNKLFYDSYLPSAIKKN